MNQTSWRHHYIPQFYLKGFTSDNGKFKIFDIQKRTFLQKGKSFPAKSYFFEVDGNSIITEDGISDFIEDSFKSIDNKTAAVFNRMNNNSAIEKFGLTGDDIALLQYFVGVMYWRIPANFEEIKNIVERKRLREIGLKILNQKGEIIDNIEFENKLKNDLNFFKAMKFHFPSITYPELFECKTPLHILPLPKGLPSICSDNPIICRFPDTFRVYSDDYIFPLSSTNLFIRGQNLMDFMTSVKIEIDLLTYKQAKRYVSCTDEKYLKELDRMFQSCKGGLEGLRFSIFKQIFGYS